MGLGGYGPQALLPLGVPTDFLSGRLKLLWWDRGCTQVLSGQVSHAVCNQGYTPVEIQGHTLQEDPSPPF